MQFGLVLPTYDQLGTREAILEAARLAEESGWDSVWVTDHVAMAPGQEHPYGHIYEALTTLAYVGALTQRVQLGTSIIVLPQRNAVVVAKEAATIDALCNGRVILAVAAGWNEREFRYLNADFHRRGRLLDEQIQVMRALWARERPTIEGKFHKLEQPLFSPRPTRPGGIPIWIGGNSDAAVQRAGRIGDGWHVTGASPDRVREGLEQIRPMVQGRPFVISARVEVDLNGRLPPEFAGLDGSKRRRLGPNLEGVVRGIEEYRQAGAEYMILTFAEQDVPTMLEHVKQVTKTLPQLK